MFVKKAAMAGRPSKAHLNMPQQQTLEAYTIPPPMKGMNTKDPATSLLPDECILAWNMVPRRYGLGIRKGTEKHNVTLGSSTGDVRSLFGRSEMNGSGTPQLFATTVNGLYVCTNTGTNQTAAVSWPSATGNAGYGVPYVYNNDNGDEWHFFADEVNGLYENDVTAAASSWALKTDITGVAEADLVFVTEHKNRLWFVERNTQDAWYLGVGAKGGTATKFSLGNKFARGGYLLGCYKWSVDGGDGVDDLLVFVSSSGEVAVYAGTDPGNADAWESMGTWFIGPLGPSRKIAENIGGEMHILSRYGLISMSDLVRGLHPGNITGQQSIASKITPILRDDWAVTQDLGWAMVPSMAEDGMLVVRDNSSGALVKDASSRCYFFSFSSPGWAVWEVPEVVCAVEWEGELYFGDESGNVNVFRGHYDATDIGGETGGAAFEYGLVTSYQDLGHPGQTKRVHYVKPEFYDESGADPVVTVEVDFNYTSLNPIRPDIDFITSGPGGNQRANSYFGTPGIGESVCLILQGRTVSREFNEMVFLSAQVLFDFGGFLPGGEN